MEVRMVPGYSKRSGVCNPVMSGFWVYTVRNSHPVTGSVWFRGRVSLGGTEGVRVDPRLWGGRETTPRIVPGDGPIRVHYARLWVAPEWDGRKGDGRVQV